MSQLLDRYRDGEHEQVWAELLAHGPDIRTEPLFSAAYDVARETMVRVRTNIEILLPRLRQIGYHLHDPDPWMEGLDLPVVNVLDRIAELELLVGAIPLSLRTWYEVGGSVSLVGSHPEWPRLTLNLSGYLHATPDPLVIVPIEIALEQCYRWIGGDDLEANETFNPASFDRPDILIGPDPLYKAGYSGGPAYTIDVPNPAADAILVGERHKTTFVDYLRLCFRWGGFPGFEQYRDPPMEAVAFLRAGLLSI